ncbi:MAG: zf-TFIIB domain-containing protein [Nannocystales bacterium]
MFAGCRCPRCSNSTLAVATIEGRKALGCPHCSGAFVGADLGLRLLAVLSPDVPPARVGIPSPPCPVCRKGMRRVVAAGQDVETCKVHGVWFDAGDLRQLVEAVAVALGKPIPAVVETLEAKQKSPPAATPEHNLSAPSGRRASEPSDLEIAGGIVGEAIDTVLEPVEAVADVVLFPFRVVGLLSELID